MSIVTLAIASWLGATSAGPSQPGALTDLPFDEGALLAQAKIQVEVPPTAEVEIEGDGRIEVVEEDREIDEEEREIVQEVETRDVRVRREVEAAARAPLPPEAEAAAIVAAREAAREALLPSGLLLAVGAGAIDYVNPVPAAATTLGGFWNARVSGIRNILSGEVAYVGSFRDIEGVTGLAEGAGILSNGVEGLLRLNAPLIQENWLFELFGTAGAGLDFVNIVNTPTNTSSLLNNDFLVSVPLGIGATIGFQRFVVEGRAQYRQAINSNLFGSSPLGLLPSAQNTWQIGANVGYEF